MSERKYSFALDIYPQQHENETKLWKFYDNLKKGKFTTTKCKKCGYVLWPPGVICPECLSDDLEYIDMPKRGRIYEFTVQYAALPPGIKPPVIQALVDFPNGIRIVTSLIDTKPEEIKPGDEVELRVFSIPPDACGDRVLFSFKKCT